jgi:hypothetical protein
VGLGLILFMDEAEIVLFMDKLYQLFIDELHE